ncbi:cupin domain-containing protein [Kitasatospora sp. NPDC058965]|uniref:cupin domain-containing protein n=1 Tax=Kitasatospora sp. NPDC058965 TaxID=3346682 RepID=UPI0036A69234
MTPAPTPAPVPVPVPTPVPLAALARALPEAWASQVLAGVAGAVVKVLRMDGRPLPAEAHPHPELLLVLDGVLELDLAGADLTLRTGELCTVPAGTRHTVRPGSRGTLLLVEAADC